jgi:hypothetical protein
VSRPPEGNNAGVFIVDDLLAWLVGLVADAGGKKLVTLVLGSDQKRALRPAVEAAVAATAAQLTPSGGQANQLAAAVGEVFRGARSVRPTKTHSDAIRPDLPAR